MASFVLFETKLATEKNKQLKLVSSVSHPGSRGQRIFEYFSLPVRLYHLMICACSSVHTQENTIPQKKKAWSLGAVT